jgi:hypothetical protein
VKDPPCDVDMTAPIHHMDRIYHRLADGGIGLPGYDGGELSSYETADEAMNAIESAEGAASTGDTHLLTNDGVLESLQALEHLDLSVADLRFLARAETSKSTSSGSPGSSLYNMFIRSSAHRSPASSIKVLSVSRNVDAMDLDSISQSSKRPPRQQSDRLSMKSIQEGRHSDFSQVHMSSSFTGAGLRSPENLLKVGDVIDAPQPASLNGKLFDSRRCVGRFVVGKVTEDKVLAFSVVSYGGQGIDRGMSTSEIDAHAVLYFGERLLPVHHEPVLRKEDLMATCESGISLNPSRWTYINFGLMTCFSLPLHFGRVASISEASLPYFESYCKQSKGTKRRHRRN